MELFDQESNSGDNSQEREMLATFLQELSENVLNLETNLIELEKNPANRDQINVVFRLFHNLKGSSAMMSMPILMEVTHWSESVLDLVRNDKMPLTTAHVDLLLESLNSVREVHENLKAEGNEGKKRYFSLLARLSEAIESPTQAKEDAGHAVNKDEPAHKTSKVRDDDMIKVSRSLIDQMMLLVSEFMQVKNRFEWLKARYATDAEFFDNCRDLEAFSAKLQRNILKLRLSPVSPLFSSMHRVVRTTCAEINKKVNFDVAGADTLLDRTILDVLSEPLMHLIRNSIDHGVESKADREAANKPEEGHVSLRAQYRSGEIHISVTDDGKGINAEKIKAKAIEKGFITAAQSQTLTVNDMLNLIFIPGFSSNDQVTKVSGRGVGMDVVKSTIESVGGQVEIQTELGVGSTFNLRLPLSLAIVDCLGFRIGGQAFAIAQANVEEVYSAFSSSVEQNLRVINDDSMVLVVRDVPIPVLPLAKMFSCKSEGTQAYILVRHGKTRFALEVDVVTGPLSIVTQPLPPAFATTAAFSGITKQGDGSMLFQVDVAKLATHVHHNAVQTGKRNTYMTTDGKTDNAAILTSSDIKRLQQKIITFRNEQRFCIPVQRAKRIVQMDATDIKEVGDQRLSYITLDGQTLPLVWVEEQLLNLPRIRRDQYSVIVFQIEDQQYGIPVDEFLGIQRMPENYDRSLKDVGISGSTVVDGETYILLDLYALVAKAKKQPVVMQSHGTNKDRAYRIIAAEDDAFFATEMLATLRGTGLDVVHFKDGLEAKVALEDIEFAKSIDLVITDIEMPNLNGLGLLRWIKSCSHTKHLPCIAYTAISTVDMRQKVAQAGALSLVSKMSMDVLLAEVARIRRGDVERAVRETASKMEGDAINRVVTFALGDDWFALPMNNIKEVSPRSMGAVIPDAPHWMRHVTFFRGQVIPVIDLGAFFGLEIETNTDKEQAVVEHEGATFAITLGRVGEVLSSSMLTSSEGLPRVSSKEEKLAACVRTALKAGDRILTLLDTNALAALARGESESKTMEGKAA